MYCVSGNTAWQQFKAGCCSNHRSPDRPTGWLIAVREGISPGRFYPIAIWHLASIPVYSQPFEVHGPHEAWQHGGPPRVTTTLSRLASLLSALAQWGLYLLKYPLFRVMCTCGLKDHNLRLKQQKDPFARISRDRLAIPKCLTKDGDFYRHQLCFGVAYRSPKKQRQPAARVVCLQGFCAVWFGSAPDGEIGAKLHPQNHGFPGFS